MHDQDLIIIAICSALGLMHMVYFVRKAIRRAFAEGIASQATHHRERVAALTNDIVRLSSLPPKKTVFTPADYQTLLQARSTLILAQLTWRALPGTDSTQLKAENQAQKILELADRISNTVDQGPAA
jgi:hypothetical protein